MRRLSPAILALLMACNSPAYEALTAAQDALTSSGDPSSGEVEDTTSVTTSGDASTGASASGATTDLDATETTGAADTTGVEPVDPPVGEPDKPSIVSVELPAKIYAAGPLPLAVQTKHTAKVQVLVDGVDAGEFVAAGDGLFTGDLPVRGAIDNGGHAVEVIATQGKYEDRGLAAYEVSTPAPGTMAWFKAGPAGSRTNRIAATPEGDTIEGGQVEVNKVTRPSLRKRSGLNGAELWSVTLDTREGAVADLAVMPDGRVWVAMNVRKPGDPSPQPRIALFDADGEFTGIEALGDLGQEVRGIAADADGGCFAVGFAPAGDDLDVGYWRVDGSGLQTLGSNWDNVPKDKQKHSFWDFATDVVIDGDVAWVIGASHGRYLDKDFEQTRGMIVPMDLHSGTVLSPVIIAPESGAYVQSVFFGGALHPEGVVVTGYGCDFFCNDYRIETWLFGAAGVQKWHQWDIPGAGLRSGRDVALDSQGRAIIGGSVTESGALRGYLFARVVHEEEALPLFEHWFPASTSSEILGVLVNEFDRLFAVGFITANGEIQARVSLIHG